MIDKLKQINKNAPVQARASFWFLVCSALQQGINVIITPIYTRIMSEGQYGGYGAYTSWYSILSIIVTLNMGEGVYQRGIVKYEDEKEEFSSSLQSLTFVLCILWFGVYFIFRNSLNSFLSLTTYQMTGMFVTMWTNAVYIFWMTEQRTQYRYRAMVAISLSVSAVQAILGISSVYFFEDKVTARILSFAGVNLVFYIWLFFSQMFRGKVFFSKRFWAHALSFCIPLIPHFLSTVILQSSDRIMIQKLAGDREAGIYTLGSAIALVMSIFNSAISHTMSPWCYTKIRDKKMYEIAPVSYGVLILIGAVNLITIAFAPEIVYIFAPAGYGGAVRCIPPIAMSAYFMFCYVLFSKISFYYGDTGQIAAATAAAAVLNLILNYLFIPVFGYTAAAYTTLLCFMLYAVFHYMVMRRVCRRELKGEYPFDTIRLLQITLAFMGTGFLYLSLYGHILLRYCLTLALMVILFSNRKKLAGYIREISAQHDG